MAEQPKPQRFETIYNVVRRSRKRYKLIDSIVEKKTAPPQHCDEEKKQSEPKQRRTRKHAWSHTVSRQKAAELSRDRLLCGNKENSDKLVTKYIRDLDKELNLSIPDCIIAICLHCFYEATNVIFSDYDHRISHYVSISNKGKMVDISARTIYVFSADGYMSGHHIWHIKCHRVYNCQALGICEHKNSDYRYGENIFDVTLNQQLGDRYIYAGDSGHSWKGSDELRPYVCSVIGDKEYYSKQLKLGNSRWCVGDIITVEMDLGVGRKDDNTKKSIMFYKNGKALCETIRIVKQCVYYPVFQVYQRGTFEVIDDIEKEAIYKPLKKISNVLI